MSSIYNIDQWNATRVYYKNDIVYQKISIGTTGVPKAINYYYALTDVPANNTPPATAPFNNQYWGGYTNCNGEITPNFIWTASYNLSADHSPKVNTIAFGNGYEQRNPDGLFTQMIRLNVSFDMRSEKEATAILQFLKARKGTESFVVGTLPPIYADATYKKRFICPTFNSNFTFHNNYTIKANFIETNTSN